MWASGPRVVRLVASVVVVVMSSYSLIRRGLAVGYGDESVLQLASDDLSGQARVNE